MERSQTKRNKSQIRSARGVHSLELIGGLLVLVPIVLYGLDYTTVLLGGQMSASCTSAAARAAAAGPPTGYGASTPAARASTILQKMVSPTAVIRMKDTVRSQENVQQAPIQPYGGPFQGTVTIRTRCDVFPPFLLPFVPPRVVLYQMYSYPWTWVMPSGYNYVNKSGAYPLYIPLMQPIPDDAP